jgi:hypothetical protein
MNKTWFWDPLKHKTRDMILLVQDVEGLTHSQN